MTQHNERIISPLQVSPSPILAPIVVRHSAIAPLRAIASLPMTYTRLIAETADLAGRADAMRKVSERIFGG